MARGDKGSVCKKRKLSLEGSTLKAAQEKTKTKRIAAQNLDLSPGAMNKDDTFPGIRIKIHGVTLRKQPIAAEPEVHRVLGNEDLLYL